jgi:hypothetical protein
MLVFSLFVRYRLIYAVVHGSLRHGNSLRLNRTYICMLITGIGYILTVGGFLYILLAIRQCFLILLIIILDPDMYACAPLPFYCKSQPKKSTIDH